MPEMTPADARRVLTEWRDELAAFRREADENGYDVLPDLPDKVNALTYALLQVWVPKDVAQTALPLVEDEVLSAKWCDEHNPHLESPTATWQALADALGGK